MTVPLVPVVPLFASVAMAVVTAVVAIVLMVDVDDPRVLARLSIVVRLPVVARCRRGVVTASAIVVAILREVVNEAARDATRQCERAEEQTAAHGRFGSVERSHGRVSVAGKGRTAPNEHHNSKRPASGMVDVSARPTQAAIARLAP
jgi:hypothetical protein